MLVSESITLSPKHGVNPTIPVCFRCGKEQNEIALMGRIGDGRKGEDIEAPMHMVLNYEPCEECKANMSLGFTVMEATNKPNDVTNMEMQKGVYPTGRFVVLKPEAAERIFTGLDTSCGNAFLDSSVFTELFSSTV